MKHLLALKCYARMHGLHGLTPVEVEEFFEERQHEETEYPTVCGRTAVDTSVNVNTDGPKSSTCEGCLGLVAAAYRRAPNDALPEQGSRRLYLK